MVAKSADHTLLGGMLSGTQYQIPTHYGFQDIPRTRFYRSRSLQQGLRSNQGHTMTMHTYSA